MGAARGGHLARAEKRRRPAGKQAHTLQKDLIGEQRREINPFSCRTSTSPGAPDACCRLLRPEEHEALGKPLQHAGRGNSRQTVRAHKRRRGSLAHPGAVARASHGQDLRGKAESKCRQDRCRPRISATPGFLCSPAPVAAVRASRRIHSTHRSVAFTWRPPLPPALQLRVPARQERVQGQQWQAGTRLPR